MCRLPEGGPQGRGLLCQKDTGRAQRVPGRKPRLGTPTAAPCPRSLEGGRAQHGGPCREGLRVRVAPGAPCPGPFQHPVCSLSGRQPSGRPAFLGWWLLPAHSRRLPPPPGPGLRNRRLAWPPGWPRAAAGAGDASPPRLPVGPGGGRNGFLLSLQLGKERVRAFLVAPAEDLVLVLLWPL